MKKILLASLLYLLMNSFSYAQIRLPKLIGHGMVLQRNTPVNIWGWSSPNENITIEFLGENHQVIANPQGKWNIKLSSLQAGGPYTMILKGKNQIQLDDIYIGDVWLCSGQSNMELPIRRVLPLYRNEVKTINNVTIRLFNVPKEYDFKTQRDDLKNGAWKPATQENIMDFSAVSYFFAKHVQDKQYVPIGIINSSLGGSPVEAWISEESLQTFDDAWQELQKFKDDKLIEEIQQSDRKRNIDWHLQLAKNDLGRTGSVHWNQPVLNDADWKDINIPGLWCSDDLKNQNGTVWFRRNFQVSEPFTAQSVHLELGCIVDADSVFVNGHFVGNTTYKYPPRWYRVPAGILKKDSNNITIKVISQNGNGGFVKDKKYELTTNTDTIDLAGTWKYKIGTKMPPLKGQTFVRWKPAGLYNAMIHPLKDYTIKGAVWYQGESNVGRAKAYEERLTTMINNWRQEWSQGDFPFLIVQLANFLEEKEEPTKSAWAELREAQYKVANSVTNTALTCTIDLGEWNDIHPLNKADIGKRLSLSAEKIAYQNKKVIASGPTMKEWKKKGNKIEILFDNTGSGLVAKNNKTISGFAIAGDDGKYVWAQARIKGKKVVVWSKDIETPQAVSYAWADNPSNANLYNQEGLPAVPFRTDK